MTSLVASLFLACSTPALASDDPTVSVASDHRVRGSIVIRAELGAVKSVLGDPVAVARIDNGPAAVSLVSKDTCTTVQTRVEHPIASVDYTARSCPTSAGFRTELLQSDGIESYESEWEMEPVEGGVMVRYMVRTIPSIAVPQFIVDRQTKGSVKRLLRNLKAHLES